MSGESYGPWLSETSLHRLRGFPGALVRVCCAGPPGLSPLIVDSRRVPFRPGIQFHIHADLVAESVLMRTLVA